MIARMWHGWTRPWDADAYEAHLLRSAIGRCETAFAVLTLWESLHAIRAFTGEDLEQATPCPEDRRFLVEPRPTVTHYQVIEPDEVIEPNEC